MYMRLFYLLLSMLLLGCNNESTNHQSGNDQLVSVQKTKENNKLSAANVPDSAQILFFDNPDGDSLRYTRFYKFISTNDSSLINPIQRQLEQSTEDRNEVKKCRSVGKIYLYANTNPVKTIYFSTRCDTCCYLYYIQDGNFKYFSMSKEIAGILAENKKKSISP